MINYEKIKNVLENIDIREVVKEAYYATCWNECRGTTQINLHTGEISGATYTTEQFDEDYDDFMDLYTVDSCTEYSREELFYDIEHEIPKGMDEYEYCKQNKISIDELKIDWLTFYAEDDNIRDQWLEEIEKREKESEESNCNYFQYYLD
ncbi:hypothetical protein SAMN05428976_1246 [Clostridium sp. USBA 49]|uniref:hypothetical protein n=1 Tax=Clostridium sp. USBA 49 TaxID=1881060 RepID=UPI00099AD5F8|nr:hypothetical protein [Clostridium sp. USBA 49]SKA92878.1 hypothetical protein SAMN05428976_1246 [Clostridium sp. USBA 49]